MLRLNIETQQWGASVVECVEARALATHRDYQPRQGLSCKGRRPPRTVLQEVRTLT
jgi:hypothetical protein